VQIAGAASTRGARIIFAGMAARSTQDLIQIAGAGRGAVQFED
jgi:hypothetical protein